MTKTRSLLLVIASLAAANVTSFFTLSHNLSIGVYPIDADSIGLPLVEGVILSILLPILLCAAIFTPKSKIFGSVMSILLCCLAVLLSGASSVSWAIPNHYTMAFAYGCVLVVCGILTVSYIRKLASNIAVKRRAPQLSVRQMDTPSPELHKTFTLNQLAKGCAWTIAEYIILPPIVGGIIFVLLPEGWLPFSAGAFFILLGLYLTIGIPIYIVVRDRKAAQQLKTKNTGD